MGEGTEKPISDTVGSRPKQDASHATFLAAPLLDGRHEFLAETCRRRVRSRSFHVDNHITGSLYKSLVVAKYFA